MQTATCLSDGPAEIPLSCGVINFSAAEIRYNDGDHCPFSRTELRLLRFLCRNAGRAISRAELLTTVWELNPAKVRTRTIDMHIAHLRRKLRDRAQPKLLRTLRREGYVLAI